MCLRIATGTTYGVAYGDTTSKIYYQVDWDQNTATFFPWDATLPITCLLDARGNKTGWFRIDILRTHGVWNYLFRYYIQYYAYYGYPLHKDRINQIRGQLTTGVAEQGNKEKRVCMHVYLYV